MIAIKEKYLAGKNLNVFEKVKINLIRKIEGECNEMCNNCDKGYCEVYKNKFQGKKYE